MTITTTTSTMVGPSDEAPPASAGGFLDALRAGRYPRIPEPLAVAVAALDHADELVRQVASAPPEGMGQFAQRVADDVLAGKGWPADFAQAAHGAQQAADRLAAQSVAVEAVKRQLSDRFPAVVTEVLDELLDGLRDQLGEVLAGLSDAAAVVGDLDVADPGKVAAATPKQRAAVTQLGELRRTYNGLRAAQKVALQASNAPVPGSSPWRDQQRWSDVFSAGVHEFSDTRRYGLPDPKPTPARFRALAARPDVWLPSTAELHQAWARLHPQATERPTPVAAYNSLRSTAS